MKVGDISPIRNLFRMMSVILEGINFSLGLYFMSCLTSVNADEFAFPVHSHHSVDVSEPANWLFTATQFIQN